jgi:glucose-6-phosphate 1-dehydrogenase
VPIFIRAGKKLAVTQTELRLVFKTPPKLGFGLRGATTEPDQLVIRLDPKVGIRLQLEAHHAGTGHVIQPIHLDMEFAEQGGEGATPYEVLLQAAMTGQTIRFTRQDSVDEQWRIMQPLLDAPPPVEPYAPGTWGPEGATELLSGYGRWHEPWTP